MPSLDIQYIADLVSQAQSGDSNAFAELFAATYQKQFAFARNYLQDDFLAQQALQETYIQALKSLSRLRDPALVVVWLNQITLRTCFRIQHRSRCIPLSIGHEETHNNPENRVLLIGGRQYNVRQIMTLPLSEAQAILLSHICGMNIGGIASLLEIRRSAVRRYMDSGRRRLKSLAGPEGGDSM